MDITIHPAPLRGKITPPPSKSQAHRLILAAALAQGESHIRNVAVSRDIEATIRCLEELGAQFRREGTFLTVSGMGANAMSPRRRLALPRLDCGESGSTLRFLIPVALAVRSGGIFTGQGRLMERPQGPYAHLFREKGIAFEQADGVLTVHGVLESGEYRLPGNVSSQFFTGLLYALPLLDGPSALIPTTQLESFGYILMTLQALGQFGVQFPATMSLPPQYHLPGNQTYQPADVTVEADWSQAAFWYAAAAMGSDVTVEGMDPASFQGDKVFPQWAETVTGTPITGCVTYPDDSILESSKTAGEGRTVRIDLSNSPDLMPPLAALGAVMDGTLRIENAGRLRLKESDRLATVTGALNALGADVTEGEDSLTIRGREKLAGGATVDCHGDHRIAMMAAVAATRCEQPVTLTGAQCVDKSYPDFWEDYERLGGQLVRS